MQKTSNHHKKPRELYHRETVLANPNKVPLPNYCNGSIQEVLLSLGTLEANIALQIMELERKAETKRATEAQLWKAQDNYFAAAKAAKAKKRNINMIAKMIARQAKDQKL
jgi:hypothetical protein